MKAISGACDQLGISVFHLKSFLSYRCSPGVLRGGLAPAHETAARLVCSSGISICTRVPFPGSLSIHIRYSLPNSTFNRSFTDRKSTRPELQSPMYLVCRL